MAKAMHRAEPIAPADAIAPAPPALLTAVYAAFALALFVLFACALWSNQNDPGRVLHWIAQARTFLHGGG